MIPPTPRLRAVTRRLAELPDLVGLADPHDPLLWVRGDRGCVGIGELLRLEFRGADRFAAAARAWRAISQQATIDDEVSLPGTGLIALGTFRFSDTDSPSTDADGGVATSVLIVPQRIVARHGSVAWVTEIAEVIDTEIDTDTDAAESTPLPPAERPALRHAPDPGPWESADLLGTTDAEADVAAYLAGVREANARIERGEVDKVVLSRRLGVTVPADADLRVPLGRLAEGYLDCWTFAIDGLFGASPETLIRSTNGAVSARVLAGTRTRMPADPVADARARDALLTSEKDQHEHAFAVQSVVTALSPFLPNLRTSEEPFALRLPNVWHLATDLGATSDGSGESANAIELVGALHPTAAVAGTPTSKAVEVIAELEPFDRGRYAGAVGWVDHQGDGEWVIALRCAQVEPVRDGSRRITAYAGGGIVLGSDPDHELAETISKFRPIAQALA